MKYHCIPGELKYSDLNSSTSLFPFTTERDINTDELQNLYFNLDLHKKMLKFIKQAQHINNKLILISKTLHAVYYYLTMLIWNNDKIKAELI